MSHRLVLTITAAVLGAFGAGFVLMPGLVFGIYGVSLNASGLMLAHVAGAAIIGLAAFAWLSRNLAPDLVQRTLAPSLLLWFTIKAVVTLIAQLQGVFNTLGWSIVGLDVLFMAAFAYLTLAGRRQALIAVGDR